MNPEDIIESQKSLLEESKQYFNDWYEREEEFRREFIGEDGEK